jgi:hypothetical protein
MVKDVGNKDWMLDSKCYVVTDAIASTYLLHFWKSGKVIIWETDRPRDTKVPYDDLIELKKWTSENGWKELIVDDRLILFPQDFEFWKRMYMRGVVSNQKFVEYEKQEVNRFSNAIGEDQDDV